MFVYDCTKCCLKYDRNEMSNINILQSEKLYSDVRKTYNIASANEEKGIIIL